MATEKEVLVEELVEELTEEQAEAIVKAPRAYTCYCTKAADKLRCPAALFNGRFKCING